jgi:5'-deoxy-5'-methylthioadenosine phosphorylase
MLAVIGGSGLTQLTNLKIARRQVVRTPYGEPSGPLTIGRIGHEEIVFLARHGYGHHLAPHEINYRANIWALHSTGVQSVVAVNSVGGIRPELVPGEIAIPEQIIDYTWGRPSTFFEGTEKPVVHIDFTLPYDGEIRQRLIAAAAQAGVSVTVQGVYACTQGPRLETAAEINRLEGDGATMVGMTGMPEAALARELSLRYASLAVVANHAAGRADSREGIRLTEIGAALAAGMQKVRAILDKFVQ